MSEPILKLENINYYRGQSQILSNINFELNRGENLAIIGANGAGKSTIVALLTGYDWPSNGKIRVMGQTFGKVNLFELRRHIGLISTSRIPEFLPGKKVREIVATGFFGSIVLPMSQEVTKEQWESVEHELKFIGMESHAEKTFKTLSTGEKMRTLIARALISEPKLLVLDEPTAGLDMKARALIIKTLEQMHERKERPSIVIVSHHLEELPKNLDKAMLIKDGKILVQGEPMDVITSFFISSTFDCKAEVYEKEGRYHSHVVEF